MPWLNGKNIIPHLLGFLIVLIFLFIFITDPKNTTMTKFACLWKPLKNSSASVKQDKANIKHHLYIETMGRFGNVMFQITGMVGIGKTTNSTVHVLQNSFTKKFTELFPRSKQYVEFVSNIPSGTRIIGDKQILAELQSKNTLPENITVNGFFESFSFWWPMYDKEVRDMLTPSETFTQQAKDYLKELMPKTISQQRFNLWICKVPQPEKHSYRSLLLVGIQVRRGDKTTLQGQGYRVADKAYFVHAMKYFENKFNTFDIYFIAVSEDKKWMKDNIKGNNVLYSFSSDFLLELTVLALCDHIIMSVGTYSWWAAWLAGGQAVFYRDHVNPNTTIGKFYQNASAFFLPHWIPMV